MLARVIAGGLFATAVAAMLATADPIGAADVADKAAKAKKAKAKKKVEPLDTAALFKKLDTNGDEKLDADEFMKLFSVQPAPKGKKAKDAGPVELKEVFKSLDADGDKTLSAEEFRGIVPAVFPAPKK